MYTCQCMGYQIGQSGGVLLKEVAAYSEVSFNRGIQCIEAHSVHSTEMGEVCSESPVSACGPV